MSLPAFDIFRATLSRFHKDRCGNFAITISYFALMCSIPLAALFASISTKILGNSELAVRSLDIFSEEFFAQLDPYFFQRVRELSQNITNLGWFGLVGSLIAASFLFSTLIHSINTIFRAEYQKSFFYNRLMEYLIMFVIGVIMLISLSITAIWTALHRTLQESPFVAKNINPELVSLIDNFFVQYLLPFTLTFLVLFSLYKFIPEIKVYTKAGIVAAAIGALLWEIFKRIFAFYVAHFSAIGIVLDRLMKGTLTSIIFFLLWLSISMVILLWGAELAAVINERITKKHEQQA